MLGGVTAGLFWQIHAGRCPEHGWFQTEVISRPPREIFPVNKPFGAARRIVVDGREVFSFPTVWNTPAAAKSSGSGSIPWMPATGRSRRRRGEHEVY